MFVGRQRELSKLLKLKKKKTSSLVVIKGRRRIGKSELIAQFAKSFDRVCRLQGLAPREGLTEREQLESFAEQIHLELGVPNLILQNWTEAFDYLASYMQKGSCVLLLDEISWLADKSPDFVGKLKIAWDLKFKDNPKFVLVLCGSVSSWIEKNLLKDSDFVGRVSLEINLEELSILECNDFFGSHKDRITASEKLKILSCIGGVPKYLEEIIPSETSEENIHRLFFSQRGMLVQEFDKIFNDIFNKRAKSYKEIVKAICSRHLSALEIAQALGKKQNGDLSEHLYDLEISGFIKRDHTWKFDGKKSRISRYRLKDNYLRFYLKYIEPIKEKINSGLFEYRGQAYLPQWETISALQFENLVLHNISGILEKLNIPIHQIINAAPYLQNKTRANHGACQIDLLIQTKYSTLYLCEIKFKKKVGAEVITEMKNKMAVLKTKRNMSMRPVLIYSGELNLSPLDQDFFDHIIDFGDLLSGS